MSFEFVVTTDTKTESNREGWTSKAHIITPKRRALDIGMHLIMLDKFELEEAENGVFECIPTDLTV